MEKEVSLRGEAITPPAGIWASLPVAGIVVAVLAFGVSAFVGSGDKAQLLFSYLVAYLFFLSIALGGLFFVLVQHLTRAGWSVVVRRLAEHVMATLPLFAVLFLPIALGYHELFHWSHADAVAQDPLLQSKEPYLNGGFFFARAAFYLAAWSALGWWYRRQSMLQDSVGGIAITRRMQTFSAPAMVIFAVTLTFAAFDWIMSLDPHWYSTIFGVYFFAGCVVAIFSVLILLSLRLQQAGVLEGVISAEHYHDMGKMLFGFVVFWAYIAFSQFMLIWYGNIPEETAWYDHRWLHGWKPVSILLAAGHFGLPFLFLLSRDVKRRRVTLTLAVVWMLVMHWIDLYWLVMPVHHEHFHLHLLDFTCLLGVGGLFVATLGWLLRGPALVPVKDPRLAESLAFENP